MNRILLVLVAVAQIALGQAAPVNGPDNNKQLTIDAIFANGGVTGREPETVKWSPDGTKVSFVQRDDSGDHGELYYIDLATGKKDVLVTREKLQSLAPPVSSIKNEREREWIRRYSIGGYQWTRDSKSLLFDSKGQLWLYTLKTGTAVQLTTSSDPNTDPKLSPDGHHLAYIRKHNLWLKPLDDATERQLTGDDKDDKDKDKELLNGEVDWVYAEELDVRSNYFWSPQGKHIAFLQMDETNVPKYPIVDWSPRHSNVDDQRYPQPGDQNPEVRLGVIGTGGGKPKWIEVGERKDREYIPRFGWVKEGMVWVQILDRAQTKLDLYFVDTNSGKSTKVLSETSEAWVPVTDMFQILDSGDKFIWPSWRDGFMQLYLYSFNKKDPLSAEAKLERQLTNSNAPRFDGSEVESVEGLNEQSGIVYFVADSGSLGVHGTNSDGLQWDGAVNDVLQKNLFSVKLDGSDFRRVSRAQGTHDISMSPDNQYFIDTFSSWDTPPSLSLCKVDGTCAAPFWQARSVESFNLPVPKRLELKAADNKTTLYGTLLLPPQDVITAHGGRVPLINNPYGGPGAQTVVDKWGGSNYLFDVILSRAGFAVLHVDNRGMAGRGKAFTAAVKGHFGDIELADQLAAIDQVLAANPVIDRDRLGWWGWSYGGYMTTYVLTHSDRFKAGVAVAPVTDWQDYDSIYTERYMGLPSDNKDGYKESSTVESAPSLQGRLLLVHGTGDDNVHMQNTVQFIQPLITANKPYDLQLYPRKTHSISGHDARVHLFTRIQDHFERWMK